MKFIRSLIMDIILTGLILFVGIYAPSHRWVINFLMIFISLVLIIYGIYCMNGEGKDQLKEIMEKNSYTFSTWYLVYDLLTSVIMLTVLAIYQFKASFIFFFAAQIIILVAKGDIIKEHRGNEK